MVQEKTNTAVILQHNSNTLLILQVPVSSHGGRCAAQRDLHRFNSESPKNNSPLSKPAQNFGFDGSQEYLQTLHGEIVV